MPTYQYRCSDCGNELEAVQKFTDPSLTECPTCDGSLRKVFNAVGVVFKGSGFYRTDSRADQKKKSGGSSKSDTVKSDGDSKSDSAGDKKSSAEKKSESSGSKQPVAAGSSSGSGSSGGSSSTAA